MNIYKFSIITALIFCCINFSTNAQTYRFIYELEFKSDSTSNYTQKEKGYNTMKKLCCAILVSASVLWSCSRSDKVPEIRAGLVNFTSGTVMISGPSGKEFAAKPGDPLVDKMTVRTGSKSVCEIYFDNTAGKISDESPVGAALMNHGVGDVVQVNLPSGATISYEILTIDKSIL